MINYLRINKNELFIPILLILSVAIGACKTNHNLDNDFINVVVNKDIVAMRRLLDKGANINANYAFSENQIFTPLTFASASGDIDIVKFLIDNGADIEGYKDGSNLPIYYAIVNNHPPIVEILLNAGIDINYSWASDNGGTLLINATQHGNIEIVKLLVSNGANVNFTGNGKYSALYRSVIYDQNATMEYLLLNGAKLNEEDKKALQKLHWFEDKDNEKKIIFLKSQNAL